jgi:hypothetical protein
MQALSACGCFAAFFRELPLLILGPCYWLCLSVPEGYRGCHEMQYYATILQEVCRGELAERLKAAVC